MHTNQIPPEYKTPPLPPGGARNVQLPLSSDSWATLSAAFPLTEDSWTQLMAVLNAMKPALVKDKEKTEEDEDQQLLDELCKVVERLHNCKAEYQHTATVKETFQDQTAWDGDVHIYKLEDHPDTDTCYAWASPIEGSEKQKVYAVLHIPPIDSPEKAVKASIVSDYQDGQ